MSSYYRTLIKPFDIPPEPPEGLVSDNIDMIITDNSDNDISQG